MRLYCLQSPLRRSCKHKPEQLWAQLLCRSLLCRCWIGQTTLKHRGKPEPQAPSPPNPSWWIGPLSCQLRRARGGPALIGPTPSVNGCSQIVAWKRPFSCSHKYGKEVCKKKKKRTGQAGGFHTQAQQQATDDVFKDCCIVSSRFCHFLKKQNKTKTSTATVMSVHQPV